VIAEQLETFLATLAADPTATGLPKYVVEEFYAYLSVVRTSWTWQALRPTTRDSQDIVDMRLRRAMTPLGS
jgi:hypothetical protein